jgi:hypothetical protein
MRPKPLPRGQRLAALAKRQHGVVSIRQLRALGYSLPEVKRAGVAGRLHRLHLGVYAVGHAKLDRYGVSLAAVLASGPRSLLSHASAGWLLGLLRTWPATPHATSPLPRKKRAGVRIHHSRTLIDEDRALVDNIPVTAVPRTCLDLAATLRGERLAGVLQRAEELKALNLPAFESVLARNKGHRGTTPLGRALGLYEPPRFTRSGFERRFVAALARAGFPRPATGWNEAGHELDVYWPELRFAVELDVFETHGTRRSFEEDRLRTEDLKLAGVELTRVTEVRFNKDPQSVLHRLARLLDQRRDHLGLTASVRTAPPQQPS